MESLYPYKRSLLQRLLEKLFDWKLQIHNWRADRKAMKFLKGRNVAKSKPIWMLLGLIVWVLPYAVAFYQVTK